MNWLREIRSFFAESGEDSSEFEMAGCGHLIHVTGEGKVFSGEAILARNSEGFFEKCHDCFTFECIRCAWCGCGIALGDPITLYEERHCQPRHDAMRAGNAYIGCLRFDCSYGFDMGGRWVEDEDNPGMGRVMSLDEMAEAGEIQFVSLDD